MSPLCQSMEWLLHVQSLPLTQQDTGNDKSVVETTSSHNIPISSYRASAGSVNFCDQAVATSSVVTSAIRQSTIHECQQCNNVVTISEIISSIVSYRIVTLHSIPLTLYATLALFSKSCYSHIRELRCITWFWHSQTVAASTVHSKLDYCNSL